MGTLLSKDEFEQQLRAKGAGYHIHHPFHVMMNEGVLSKKQVQIWVANRYYYQIAIPQKDAAILSNCPVKEIRKGWITRIIDHDGDAKHEGGIEAWIKLGLAVGLTRNDITSLKYLIPGVKFAVDAYVNFARQRPWQEAVCSSLTELFAPHIHKQRINSWPEKYPWIDETGLIYFKKRLIEAPRDVIQGLSLTLDYFGKTERLQKRALDILQFKLDVLWAMVDAIMLETLNIKVEGKTYTGQSQLTTLRLDKNHE